MSEITVANKNTRSSYINVDGIPSDFKAHILWAVWERIVNKDGKEKKIPKNPQNILWDCSWKSDNLKSIDYCVKKVSENENLGGVAYSIRPTISCHRR